MKVNHVTVPWQSTAFVAANQQHTRRENETAKYSVGDGCDVADLAGSYFAYRGRKVCHRLAFERLNA